MAKKHVLQYIEDLENTRSSDEIMRILERIYQDVNIGKDYTIHLQKRAIKLLKDMIVRY